METIKIRVNKGNGWEVQKVINNPYYPRFTLAFFFKGKERIYTAFDNKLGIRYTGFVKKALITELECIINL